MEQASGDGVGIAVQDLVGIREAAVDRVPVHAGDRGFLGEGPGRADPDLVLDAVEVDAGRQAASRDFGTCIGWAGDTVEERDEDFAEGQGVNQAPEGEPD